MNMNEMYNITDNFRLNKFLKTDDFDIESYVHLLGGFSSEYSVNMNKIMNNLNHLTRELEYDTLEYSKFQILSFKTYYFPYSKINDLNFDAVVASLKEEKNYKKLYKFISFITNIIVDTNNLSKKEQNVIDNFKKKNEDIASSLLCEFLKLFENSKEYLELYYQLTRFPYPEYKNNLIPSLLKTNDVNKMCYLLVAEEDYTENMSNSLFDTEMIKHIIRKEKIENTIDPYIDSLNKISNKIDLNDYYPVLCALVISDRLNDKYNDLYNKLYNTFINGIIEEWRVISLKIRSYNNIGNYEESNKIRQHFQNKFEENIKHLKKY